MDFAAAVEALKSHDLKLLISTVSYIGVFAIVFIESGLLVGFFLPGDSLLFTAGFLASQGFFDIKLLALGCFICAVLGDSVGYFIGHKFGRRLFKKEDSLLFHKDHLARAESFYIKHGGKTIILARFMPFIRTFAPVVAGIGAMHYPKFLFFNLIGALLWAVGVTFAGYFLGSLIPDVDKYLLPIIGAVILVSIAPGFYHALKTKENRVKIYSVLRSLAGLKGN
ncbi:MAG: VTT domain-containing protein [Candidatus Daviesbacteria bacterium]|nr:VTT domain-containing protein [Candidatus Daviesbacteria bacterium]